MRICSIAAAVFALASADSAEAPGRPSAILVSPIHEAQIVRADEGMDHVEYDLLVLSVRHEPVRLSSVTIRDLAGKDLMRIEGDALAAVTQALFAHTETTAIPASAAVAVEVDLILPPNSAPERLTHRIAYALKQGSELGPMFGNLNVDAPDVTIDRRPTIVIKAPVEGKGWLVSSGCCKPNLHRDLRAAVDGARIETPEIFSLDYAKIKNDRIFDGDGSENEQHYAYREDVLAVADEQWSRSRMSILTRSRTWR